VISRPKNIEIIQSDSTRDPSLFEKKNCIEDFGHPKEVLVASYDLGQGLDQYV